MKNKIILSTTLAIAILLGQSTAFAIKEKKQTDHISPFEYVNINWWKQFNDPYLEDYIIKALTNNKDIQIASLTIDEYTQYVKIQFGAELPSANVSGAYVGTQTLGNSNLSLNFSDYIFAVPLMVNYELDLFGKNHNKTKAVKELKKASIYQDQSTNIAISSMVASTYLNIVQLDKLIELQKDIVAYRKTIYELMSEQYKYGYVSLQDTLESNKAFTSSRIALTNLEKEQQIALHAFAILLGESPEVANSYKRNSFEEITKNITLPENVESSVITNRPDVQAMEAQLRKASIDIKVARKEFLPTININGVVGFNAIKLGQLLNQSFGSFALFPMISQDLFAGGRKIANLKLKKVSYEKMLRQYEKTNLIAIQEVNDALVKIKYDQKQDKDNQAKLKLEEKNESLAKASYDEGVISLLDYTRSKEMLTSAQRDTIISSSKCMIDAVGLYKATGAKI